MSVKPDAVRKAHYQNATEKRALEGRVSSIILNVYQNAGIEKDNDSMQSIEIFAKTDEIRRFSNKKLNISLAVHRAIIEAEEFSKASKREDYQHVSGVMGISYNPFLSTEAGAAYISFEVLELLKF